MTRFRGTNRAPLDSSRYALAVIDTHCHLTFADLSADVPGLLDEAAAVGVTGIITISTTTADALDALHLAELFDRVWCSVGVHPLYADQGPHRWEVLARVAASPRCVAFGELGLDHHYDKPDRTLQQEVLVEQLGVIRAISDTGNTKPIVLHCRKAFDALIPILEQSSLDPSRFVFHCFTGTPDEATRCLDFGAMISFTGVVTYPNAPEVREAAKLVPSDRIMVETDAPFLSPIPHRGKRPNRPAWVRHTAEALADLRGEDFDAFCANIDANTARFYGIEP